MSKILTEKQLFDAHGNERGGMKSTAFVEEQKNILRMHVKTMDGKNKFELQAGCTCVPNLMGWRLHELRSAIVKLQDCGVL